MRTWATFFYHNKSNKYKSNSLYPGSQFFINTGRYGVRIGPSRTFAVSLFKISLLCMVLSLFRIALSLFRSHALPPIRCFASPFRSSSRPFIVLHGPFVLSPSRCFAISLFRCFAVSLFRPFVVSQSRSFIVSKFRCFVL